MKATKVIIAAVLILLGSSLFADNNITLAPVAEANATISLVSLAPATPVEATFEEIATQADYSVFAPVTPVEADFNNNDLVQPVDFSTLAPTTPSEADFSDIL
ncbi:MAG: hypothetical protein NTW10_00365 [Bacteroidetes bacterium]|nr:hypothetical protein [Bacteroidota bacterium]